MIRKVIVCAALIASLAGCVAYPYGESAVVVAPPVVVVGGYYPYSYGYYGIYGYPRYYYGRPYPYHNEHGHENHAEHGTGHHDGR